MKTEALAMTSEDQYEAGLVDGHRVGRSNIAPDGTPAGGYNQDLSASSWEYRKGLSEGRAARIADYVDARGGDDDGLG